MRKIRILIVDHAPAVRRLTRAVLSDDPALEVVGAAPSGRIALAKLAQVNPDLVTLDVDLPDISGLDVLGQIRRTYPALPVILFGARTQRGAPATLEALARGASDYVARPVAADSAALLGECIRSELVPKIKLLCDGTAAHQRGEPRVLQPARPLGGGPVEIVAIGASTGGPNALTTLLTALPASFPVPVVVVQHMPPMFTRLLADRLDARCGLHVREGVLGNALTAGTVWLAPGDYHMAVERDGVGLRLHIHQGPPQNSCRPSVDVLFHSAAEACGAGVLAIVLTGMGQDGLQGCRRIRASGGQVLAQDETTSVVWGMPGYVAGAGLADKVLPIGQLHGEILRRAWHGRGVRPGVPADAAPIRSSVL